MNEPYLDHPSEDALERFLLNQSEQDELDIVETHFLACESCVTRLEILELNISATRKALESHQAEQAKKAAQPVSHWRRWMDALSLPKLSFAGAGLAACALTVAFVSVPRDVNLVAERGNEATTVQKWVPLHLHLQAREMKAGPVTVELVRGGMAEPLWRKSAVIRDEGIDVKAPRLTESGDYQLQVYSPSANDEIGDLVKEYSIKVKPGL